MMPFCYLQALLLDSHAQKASFLSVKRCQASISKQTTGRREASDSKQTRA
jgi:hypothetical protein